MIKHKKIVLDMFLNIIAVTIPIAVLQFIVYPITAKAIGSDEYGLMLTIYSVWIMVSNSLGNVLNNIRILHNSQYNELGLEGDFNVLFIRWSVINALIIGVVIFFYCDGFNLIHITLGILVSILIIIKAYLEVGFRIILNYKAITINGILLSIGFLIGGYIARTTGIWESIFLIGYLFSSGYCFIGTKLFSEPYRKTPIFKAINKDTNKLIIATIISNMMNYADKLVLYPLMGGHTVSVYYTATILGKVIGMLTSPINSVALSYISKWKINNKKLTTKVLLIAVIICIIGYAITICIYKPVIGILFPQWIEEVMYYIPITTINVMLLVLISALSPFILKFCDMKWQIIINSISVIIYFLGALILWNLFGLLGFCLGAMIGTLVKLIIMITIYYIKI